MYLEDATPRNGHRPLQTMGLIIQDPKPPGVSESDACSICREECVDGEGASNEGPGENASGHAPALPYRGGPFGLP